MLIKGYITSTLDEETTLFETLRGMFYICDDGTDIYSFMMSSFNDKDLLEFTYKGNTYRVFMLEAWPVQIAGPRLDQLHVFKGAPLSLPAEYRPLVDPLYRVKPSKAKPEPTFADWKRCRGLYRG